ncbi:MAG: lysophospholipid acyltransferase family protein [Thermodesulfobacteriota bacterium]
MITDPVEAKLFRIWKRRLISFSLYFSLWFLATAGFPVIALFTLIPDLMLPHRAALPRTRCVLFFTLYLNCEMLGLAGAFLSWIISGAFMGLGRERFIRQNAWLQARWAHALLHSSLKIFSMSIRVEGIECAFPGPIILLIRHASTADTVLASVLIANTHRMLLRFVLKRELLWDPCLDVVGNRLPNVFVDRSGQHTERELSCIRELATGMGQRDGVLIYPEGTRFYPRKLETIRAKLSATEQPEIMSRVNAMRNVLPPRMGGFSAAVEGAPEADIVICAHTGFEAAVNFRQFWRGDLIGKTVHVNFRRIAAREIPGDHPKRKEWLLDRWLEVDRWTTAHKP